jgi:aspartate/glutamate racemase
MLGVLMLATTFRRPVGDIGNPATFPFPVLYETVPTASVRRVVMDPDPALIGEFIAAGRLLEQRGAKAIATSCGFLSLYQADIQAQLSVPFAASSLLQIPPAERLHGQVGVITARAASLTERHFTAAGCSGMPAAVEGMDSRPAFTGAIIEGKVPLNERAVEREVAAVTEAMLRRRPEVRAIVLECTNLPPYAVAVRNVSGLPVYDSTTLCLKLMNVSR